MSFKVIVSWVTLGLVVLIVFLSRKELLHAWHLMGHVNLPLLLLLIPLQLLAYYAAGASIFSYLRAKGTMQHVSWSEKAKMALEMNFVNHTLPSGGVSGISYMTWRLGKFNVSAGRAASAQAVRYVSGFIATAILIMVALLMVTIDGSINRWIIFVSSAIVLFMIIASFGLLMIIGSQRRMRAFADWASQLINRLVRKLTNGRKREVIETERILHFFSEMHDDYLELRRDLGTLKQPILWALVFTICDALIFSVTFWALGTPVNPAPILIAYALASVAGFIVVTPGGAGAYEAIMVAFLAVAGISSEVAIAGIILTRVILLVTTIALGYVFYQQALNRYGDDGKSKLSPERH
jgi:uncharacterized protein (TIRG00374 family)